MAPLFLSAYKNIKQKFARAQSCLTVSGEPNKRHNVAKRAACDSPRCSELPPTPTPPAPNSSANPGFHLKEAAACAREQNMPVLFRALHLLWSLAAGGGSRQRTLILGPALALRSRPVPFQSNLNLFCHVLKEKL